ncbi:hypothetical protein K435DRAFT_178034 [Dendrothele bispora CBS 962.96]|uniref:Pali-domain-containing protein n=1 Tax=Dendrothele bispora (strain CBS 962.96) TaxID=1314807 RepID=A0A4V4HIV0_DENBC|nr:hypothetical protein K435DRAFT_178034 [Dendrothele bispora CBS 962.96]
MMYRARRHIPRILASLCSGQYLSLSFLKNPLFLLLPNYPILFYIIAALLLVLVSLSSPIFDKIFFLSLTFDGNHTLVTERYGLWGFTKSTRSYIKVGYAFPGYVVEGTFYTHFTKTFVLHPIGALFAALAALATIFHRALHRTLFSTMALIVTLIAWILDMIVFTVVRDLYRNRNIVADYGNGLWLTLGAFLTLLISACMARRHEATDDESRSERIGNK